MNVAQAAAWCRASSLPTVSKLKYLALLVFVGSVSLNLYYAYVPTKYTLAPFTVVRSDVCEWPIPSDMKAMVSSSYDLHRFANAGIPISSTKWIYFKERNEQAFISEMDASSDYELELVSEDSGYTFYKLNVSFLGEKRVDYIFLANGQSVHFSRFAEKDVLAMYDHCKATLLDDV